MFFDSYLSMHVYLLDFRFTTDSLIFIYVTGHCIYLYAWTTSLDHVHVWLPEHANWLYLTYSLGYFLTTLDLHVQILEPKLWWPFYSWSECAVEAWINYCLSGPSFFPAPLIGSRDSHLCTREYFSVFLYCIHAFTLLDDLIFLEYCIMLRDNCVLVLILLECILPPCFRTLINYSKATIIQAPESGLESPGLSKNNLMSM